jgi:hypothetical protein
VFSKVLTEFLISKTIEYKLFGRFKAEIELKESVNIRTFLSFNIISKTIEISVLFEEFY